MDYINFSSISDSVSQWKKEKIKNRRENIALAITLCLLLVSFVAFLYAMHENAHIEAVIRLASLNKINK